MRRVTVLVATAVIGAMLMGPAGAVGVTTTIVTASTTVKPNGLRLAVSRSFAGGALRFDPAPASAVVIRSRASVLRTARRELEPGTKEPSPELFFASYDLETTERVTGALATAKRQRHTVWVVRFPGVEGVRRSGVILRNNLPTAVPVTTIALSVRTDILVVVDDVTGRVLLRSEYAAESDTTGRRR